MPFSLGCWLVISLGIFSRSMGTYTYNIPNQLTALLLLLVFSIFFIWVLHLDPGKIDDDIEIMYTLQCNVHLGYVYFDGGGEYCV